MNQRLLLLFIGILWTNNLWAQTEIGVWEVEKGTLIKEQAPNEALAAAYWKQISKLLPQDLMNQYVVSFRLFTDGRDGLLGGLHQMGETVAAWQLELDTADANIFSQDSAEVMDYMHTLIHEFGHLLTLNTTQIELTEDEFEDSEKGYLTAEGYALNSSYLGQFVNEFWDVELLEAWDKIMMIEREEKRFKRLYQLYNSLDDEFVSDYAAHSPEEDIAESWTFFILNDKPKGEEIYHQKILFFYQFPELVAYRTEIRSKLPFIPKDYLENYNRSGKRQPHQHPHQHPHRH